MRVCFTKPLSSTKILALGIRFKFAKGRQLPVHTLTSIMGHTIYDDGKANMFYQATAFQQAFFCESVTSGPPSSCNNTLDDYSINNAISLCLAEAPVDGLCTKFGSARKIGTMPNWDTSLVTNMNGCTRVLLLYLFRLFQLSRMFNRNLPLMATFLNGIHRV